MILLLLLGRIQLGPAGSEKWFQKLLGSSMSGKDNSGSIHKVVNYPIIFNEVIVVWEAGTIVKGNTKTANT